MPHHARRPLKGQLYTLIGVEKRPGISLPGNIKLLGPVHLGGPQYSTQPPAHEVDQVFPPPAIKRRLMVAPAGGLEVPVPARVHPLVGGHGKDHHLVELADSKTRHPDKVKEAHDEHQEHPGAAGHGSPQAGEYRLFRVMCTGRGQVGVAAPPREEGKEGQEKQITWQSSIDVDTKMLRISPTDKVLMILLSNTVSHPGTVVVKPRDTPCERENKLYQWAH